MIEINGKEYVMRGLKTQDIYKMSRILKKMGVKVSIGKNDTMESVGADFILKCLENLHLAEKEVNSFLGELIGMKPDEFNELEIEDAAKVLNEFRNLKGLESFFTLAAKSM